MRERVDQDVAVEVASAVDGTALVGVAFPEAVPALEETLTVFAVIEPPFVEIEAVFAWTETAVA